VPAAFNDVEYPLTHLFVAHFLDGSVISQTPEDKSRTREGGSTYTDVLAKIESEPSNPLVSFAIYNSSKCIAVDLVDGHFELRNAIANLDDGGPVFGEPLVLYVQPSVASIPIGAKDGRFTVVYNRVVQADFITWMEDGKQYTKQGERRCRYQIGWIFEVPQLVNTREFDESGKLITTTEIRRFEQTVLIDE